MAAANGTFKVILAILALALLSLALLHYYEYTFHSNTSSKSSSSNNGRRKNDHLDTVENGGGKLSTLRRSVKVTFKDQNVDRVVKPKARDQQQQQQQRSPSDMADEKPGQLICNGKRRVTEIVYWKNISSDALYESPVTPHHGVHHDKYLTFEYDNGGWNNMRMGIECLLVAAHAMGRTFVVPPQQHLYLISMNHKDAHDVKPHDEMGFEDMYDVELLVAQRSAHYPHGGVPGQGGGHWGAQRNAPARYAPACLPTCLPTYPPAFLPAYLPTYLPTCLPTCLPSCLPACLPTHLPSCLPAYLPTYLRTLLHSLLPLVLNSPMRMYRQLD